MSPTESPRSLSTGRLVFDAAEALTRRGVTPFRLSTLISEVQKADPDRERTTIQPTVQGMTINAGKGPRSELGLPLERVERGVYQLRSGKDDGAVSRSAAASSPSVGRLRGARPSESAQSLNLEFMDALRAFGNARPFTGPSLYFHYRAIEFVRSFGSITSALNEVTTLEYLYAVLTSWGMHRLGSRGSELVDFESFSSSLLGVSSEIDALRLTTIGDLATAEDAREMAATLWDLIRRINVSATASQLVSGSKTLHHLLPDLVPPMDRRYTGSFFFGSSGRTWTMGESRAFAEMYPLMVELVAANTGVISMATRASSEDPLAYMATSSTKVLDNAIVGYVLLHDL